MNEKVEFKGVLIRDVQDAIDAYRAARDRAEVAEAKLREAVEKADYWEAHAEELRECMKDAVEIGDAKLLEAVEVMRAVLPAVRKAGFVSSAQVLEAFLTDMEEL